MIFIYLREEREEEEIRKYYYIYVYTKKKKKKEKSAKNWRIIEKKSGVGGRRGREKKAKAMIDHRSHILCLLTRKNNILSLSSATLAVHILWCVFQMCVEGVCCFLLPTASPPRRATLSKSQALSALLGTRHWTRIYKHICRWWVVRYIKYILLEEFQSSKLIHLKMRSV